MRRFWSISTVLALVASLFAPIPAAAMESHPTSCARMAGHGADQQNAYALKSHAHHCAAMHEQSEPQPASTDGDSINSREESCPMDCCAQRSLPNATAIVSFSLIPPLAVTDAEVHFVPVIFTSAGFSSHTDRGPPTA